MVRSFHSTAFLFLISLLLQRQSPEQITYDRLILFRHLSQTQENLNQFQLPFESATQDLLLLISLLGNVAILSTFQIPAMEIDLDPRFGRVVIRVVQRAH
jgi:hypothetical protein